MNLLKNKKVNLAVGIIFSAFFLYLAVKQVNFREFFISIKNVNIWIYLSSLFATFLAYYFRALRWKILLRPIGEFKISELFGSLMIGFMANNIFPARAGEFLRAYSLGKKLNISSVSSFGTIVLERILDGIILGGSLIYSILFYPFPEILKRVTYLVLVGYILLLVIFFMFQRNPIRTSRLILNIFFFVPEKVKVKIRNILDSFIEGFKILNSTKDLIIVFIYSILVWLSSALIIYVVLLAGGFVESYNLTFVSSIVVLAICAVGTLLPAAPGYIGTSQYFTILSLEIFAVTQTDSLAFSVLHFISQWLPVNILGFYYFYTHHIKLESIKDE